jgi:hypothetical protein
MVLLAGPSNMNTFLCNKLALLAQAYDEVEGSDRFSIVFGALAFPALIIIALVIHRLKCAKANENQIEILQGRIAELERAKEEEFKSITPNNIPQSRVAILPDFTVLIDSNSDMVGKLVETLIRLDLESQYSVNFIHFTSEAELLKLAKDKSFDLIFLYISNVKWETGNPLHNKDFTHVASLLGQIIKQYGKPIIATQGADLTQRFKETEVVFIEAPFNVEEFKKLIHRCVPVKNIHSTAASVPQEMTTTLVERLTLQQHPEEK